MSDRQKATAIIAVMARIRAHDVIHLEAEDVLSKCSVAELNYYYRVLCTKEKPSA